MVNVVVIVVEVGVGKGVVYLEFVSKYVIFDVFL